MSEELKPDLEEFEHVFRTDDDCLTRRWLEKHHNKIRKWITRPAPSVDVDKIHTDKARQLLAERPDVGTPFWVFEAFVQITKLCEAAESNQLTPQAGEGDKGINPQSPDARGR